MLTNFEYAKPITLTHAVQCLAEKEREVKILSGGTDLLVALRRKQVQPALVIDIKGLKELTALTYTPGQGLSIGAAVCVNRLAEADVVRQYFPALAAAARVLASYQLRNRATVGGNICNASPAADLVPPLLVYEGVLEVVSQRGSRRIPLQDFFTGVKQHVLERDELLQGVFLPDTTDATGATGSTGATGATSATGMTNVTDVGGLYLKQGRLKGHDLSIIGLAARLNAAKQFRFAVAAAAPTPLRLFALEELLNAQPFTPALAELAAQAINLYIHPISDVRATAEYRRHMAAVFVRRAVSSLVTAGGKQDG